MKYCIVFDGVQFKNLFSIKTNITLTKILIIIHTVLIYAGNGSMLEFSGHLACKTYYVMTLHTSSISQKKCVKTEMASTKF